MKKIQRFLTRTFIPASRAVRVIAPLFLVTGIYHIFSEDILKDTIGIVLLTLTAVSLYFGFIHFLIFKPKWDDFDKSQQEKLKEQYWFRVK